MTILEKIGCQTRVRKVIDHFPYFIDHFPKVIGQSGEDIDYFPTYIDHFPEVIVVLGLMARQFPTLPTSQHKKKEPLSSFFSSHYIVATIDVNNFAGYTA